MNCLYLESPLNVLVEIEKISVRAQNILKKIGLNSIKNLLDYYQANETFNRVRDCGVKTDNELIEICIKYKDLISIFDIINMFNPEQINLFNAYFIYRSSQLSYLLYKPLRINSGMLDIYDKIRIIYANDYNCNKMGIIQYKLINESDAFKNDIIKYCNGLQNISKELFIKSKFNELLKSKFNEFYNNDIETFLDLYDSVNNKIKLFGFINKILNAKFEKETDFIQYYFYVNANRDNFENPIFKKYKNEKGLYLKIRQKRILLENKIKKIFNFISIFNSEIVIDYGFTGNSLIYIVDNTLADRTNTNEGVNFNSKFYCVIFGLYLKESHAVLNDFINLGLLRIRTGNYYLINNSYLNNFDYQLFYGDLIRRSKEIVKNDYTLHLKSYLNGFLHPNEKNLSNEILIICETIISKDFKIMIIDGSIKIKKNSVKRIFDYVYEILEENENSMTENEIRVIFNERYSLIPLTERSISGVVTKHRDKFIYLGRTKTYGLRKWKNEKATIKEGSLADLVCDFLNNEEHPQKRADIYRYVLQYRSHIKELNLINNIYLDKKKRFNFFKGDYIGLKSKEYTNDYTEKAYYSRNKKTKMLVLC